jgi:Fe-S-cluster formation regulator IscX/YfhJ
VYSHAITVAPADSLPDLPEPSASGTLVKTPLPHLLVYAHDKQLTGTFEFEGPSGQVATLLTIEGQPTKARTTEVVIYLGRVLVDLGILSEEQLADSLPGLLAGTELHGQRLIRAGLITEEELELGLRAQLIRQMQALVHLPAETTFKYYDHFDGLHSYGGDGHVGIDPFPVVWACLKASAPWEHVHVGLTRIGTSGIQLAASAETDRFSFDKAERTTIELLRQRPWRMHELTDESAMAPRLVQLLAYCLLVTKQLDMIRESQLPGQPDDPTEDPPPSSPFATTEIRPAAVPPGQRVARVQLAQVSLGRRAAVEEDVSRPDLSAGDAVEKNAGSTSYVATQPRTTRRGTTQPGYPRSAIVPEPSASAPAMTAEASAVVSSEPVSPRVPAPPPPPPPSPRTPETSAPGVVDEGDASPSSSNPTSSEKRATPMTPELAARKKEIVDKGASIDKEDYFAVLGVARDTPSSAIQKAFFALAKKWHPDRVSADLQDVKDVCAKVFSRMSEAHQTLTDPTKRVKYEASIKSGGVGDDSAESQAQVMAILGAATDFQKAEICLKRNDTRQAEDFCKRALDVDPKQADYIAMMAWLQSLKPMKQDPTSTQEQVQELSRAIAISQACERAFFYRAMLLKRLGEEAKAIKDFKRAVELNPRNVDAQREVRLFNMRGGVATKPSAGPSAKPAKKEEGGIFGKLFKK